jgi:hypothetical protein
MRRRLGRLTLVLAVGLWSTTAWALPAAACSCVAFESLAAFAGDPNKHVFSGTITASGEDGAVVAVDRWFQGPGDAQVRLAGEFGPQSAACQVMPPPVGSRWLYVTFIARPGDAPQVNLCTPQAQLDGADPNGAKMELEAIAVFGAGEAPVDLPEEVPPPAAPVGLDSGVLPVIVGGIGIAVIALFGGLALLAKRRAD